MWHDDTHVFWRSVKGEGVTDEEIITLIDLDRISRSCKWMSYNCPLLLSVTSDCCRSYKTCFTVRASKFEDWFMIKIHQHLRFSDSSPLMAVGVSKVQIKMTVACWVSRRCPWFSVRATPTWRTKRCHWSHPMGSEEGTCTIGLFDQKTKHEHKHSNWNFLWKVPHFLEKKQIQLCRSWRSFFGRLTPMEISPSGKLIEKKHPIAGELSFICQGGLQGICPVPTWVGLRKKSEYLEQKDNVGWFSAVWMLGGSSVWCGFSKMFYSRKGDVKKYIATNT